MNKYKFIDYLHHPKKVTKDQAAKLLEVVEDYPYFQTARTLVAKVKSNQEDSSASRHISSASLYVFDRSFLRKYINEDLFIIEPKEASETREKIAKNSPEPKRRVTVPKPGERPSEGKVSKDASVAKPTPRPVESKRKKDSEDEVKKKIELQAKKASSPAVSAPKPTERPESESNKPTEPEKERSTPEADATENALVPGNPSLDKLIEEVYQDIAELQKSKARFREWQEKNDMEEAVEKAVAAAEVKVPDPEKEPSEKADEEQATPAQQPAVDKNNKDKGKSEETKEPETPKEKESSAVASKPTEGKAEEDTSAKKETTRAKKPTAPAKKAAAAKKKTTAKAPKKATTNSTQKTTSKASSSTDDKSISETKQVVKKSTASTKKSTAKADSAKTEKKKTSSGKETVPKSSKATASNKKSTVKVKSSPSKEKVEKEEIIDKFIETQPRISKPDTADSASKEDLSKKSTRFHVDIASEYLAEIYIEQGKNQRAIEIYKNLCLKFPEKKSYFAGLIRKLKKE
ncbi:MAG: hypothetical protein ACO2ZZ_09675 [Cyclobacteriaceae bacterium]